MRSSGRVARAGKDASFSIWHPSREMGVFRWFGGKGAKYRDWHSSDAGWHSQPRYVTPAERRVEESTECRGVASCVPGGTS